MMELSFQGISAALPSSDATSIRAEWLSVSRMALCEQLLRGLWPSWGPRSPAGGGETEQLQYSLNMTEDKKAYLYFHRASN